MTDRLTPPLTRAQRRVLELVRKAGELPTTAHTHHDAVSGTCAAALVRRGLLDWRLVDHRPLVRLAHAGRRALGLPILEPGQVWRRPDGWVVVLVEVGRPGETHVFVSADRWVPGQDYYGDAACYATPAEVDNGWQLVGPAVTRWEALAAVLTERGEEAGG